MQSTSQTEWCNSVLWFLQNCESETEITCLFANTEKQSCSSGQKCLRRVLWSSHYHIATSHREYKANQLWSGSFQGFWFFSPRPISFCSFPLSNAWYFAYHNVKYRQAFAVPVIGQMPICLVSFPLLPGLLFAHDFFTELSWALKSLCHQPQHCRTD